jgi:hypothetical protein
MTEAEETKARDFALAVLRAWAPLGVIELEHTPAPLLAAIVVAHLDLIQVAHLKKLERAQCC